METRIGAYTDKTTGDTHKINIYTNLSLKNRVNFVNSTVLSLLNEARVRGMEERVRIYSSVIKDEVFDYMLIKYFTDYDCADIDNSDNIVSDIEELLTNTNIVDIVKANAEDGIIEKLGKSVSDNITYNTGIKPDILSEALVGLINKISERVDAIDIQSVMEMANKINGMNTEDMPERIAHAYYDSELYKRDVKKAESAKAKKKAKTKNTKG